MKNFRAFTIKYIGATNHKPSRVSIRDNRYDHKKIIPYDYEYNNIYEIAQSYLESIGIFIVGVAENKKGYVLFSENFEQEVK